jgi:ribosomal protein S18 acetylase RimI-like enzyme
MLRYSANDWEKEVGHRFEQVNAKTVFELSAIRPARMEDSAAIARIFLESAGHHASLDPALYFVPDIASITERYSEGRQHSSGNDDEHTTFVAEVEGEVVGFIDARLNQSSDAMHREMVFCHIVEIAVSNQSQSKGIGTQLLQAAEHWGRQRGAHIALLEYHSSNSQASAFYRHHMGYRVTSITVVKNL